MAVLAALYGHCDVIVGVCGHGGLGSWAFVYERFWLI